MSRIGSWAFRAACGVSWIALLFMAAQWLNNNVLTFRCLLEGWSIHLPGGIGERPYHVIVTSEDSRDSLTFEDQGLYLSRFEPITPIVQPSSGSPEYQAWAALAYSESIHSRWGLHLTRWGRITAAIRSPDGANILVGRRLIGYENLLLVPYGFLFAATGLLPLAGVTRILMAAARRRRLERWAGEDRCLVCGYDLRASRGQCPECGRRALLIESLPLRREKVLRLAVLAAAAFLLASGGIMIVTSFMMRGRHDIPAGVETMGVILAIAGAWLLRARGRRTILAEGRGSE